MSIKLFKRDLKRIFTNFIAAIVIIGVILLPAAYAWFNIAANMDPYANTANIKIGVACEDKGASTDRSGDINAGELLMDKLAQNDSLGWTFVSADEAASGVESGDYYASIVIPENFSKDLLSFLDGEIGSPEIKYYVNEKKNAIAPKVTGTGASTIQTEINQRFKEVATATVAEIIKEKSLEISDDIGQAGGNVNSKLSEVQRTLDGINSSIITAKKTNKQAKAILKRADKSIDNARDANNNVAKHAGKVEFVKAITDLTGGEIDRIDRNIGTIPPVLSSADSTLDVIGKSTHGISRNIDGVKDSVNAITGSAQYELIRLVSNIDEDEVGSFFNSPIEVKARSYYPVENYGSGMTPFYNMLAIWVGGIILIAIIKLVVDDEGFEEELKPSEAYLGRWMLFVFFGILQSLIICLGDIFLLKVQCEHPVLFCLAGVWASIVYVSIIFTLATSFRHIGKALAVLLVILQIPGSGGTFPVEMTGSFFRIIHPLLPFKYAITATRDAIAGLYGNTYIVNMAILVIYLALAMFTGLVLRLGLININSLFDNSLAKTGMMATEHNSRGYDFAGVRAITRAVTTDEETAEKLKKSIETFESSYKLRARRGVLSLLAVPQVLMIMMFMIDKGKMFMLIGWIVTLIVISVYLIVLEFIHHRNLQIMGGERDA